MTEIKHDDKKENIDFETMKSNPGEIVRRTDIGTGIEMAKGPDGVWVLPLYVDKKILKFKWDTGTLTLYLTDDGERWLCPYDSIGRKICYATLENKTCTNAGCKYAHDPTEASPPINKKKKKHKSKKKPANRYQLLADMTE